MTSIHGKPSWQMVFKQQMKTVGLALTKQMLLFPALFLVIGFSIATAAVNKSVFYPVFFTGTDFPLSITFPIFWMGLFLPFIIWKSDKVTKRAYHWVMPVDRRTHTWLKVLAGWIYVMLLVAVYCSFFIIADGVGYTLSHFIWSGPVPTWYYNVPYFNVPWRGGEAWTWGVPFTLATTTYLLGSAAVVGSKQPGRWIVSGILSVITMFFVIPLVPEKSIIFELCDAFISGRYGVIALFAHFRHFEEPIWYWKVVDGLFGWYKLSSMSVWIITTLIWTLPSAAIIWVTANWRRS